ncbi:low-affinity phosphodiesterase [Naematelia encephala]|uniref:Low-affinity phosphodiesterase n=1 Tax=Naematelia encephala TaxID=71784 RepID=A0A1Y2AUQ0_9TREE|nr:low-affinity phosphodiesterase [Naematelia encephala]
MRDRLRKPVFELVVLGSGGGPLETDCSGYLVKPYLSAWEDGILALEGVGSGLGALAMLLESKGEKSLFPTLKFPKTHDTPLLKAAYVFSYLACYLVTHAHLDHALSLIMLSGSVPPRPKDAAHFQAPLSAITPPAPEYALTSPRLPVYGTRRTLEKLAVVYGGDLWPELGSWAPERPLDVPEAERASTRKRRKAPDAHGATEGVCVSFSPLVSSKAHRPLDPSLPISTLTYPVSHGCTSHGRYESSAMFIRYDPGSITHSQNDESAQAGREFLFFGDLESGWRAQGEESVDVQSGQVAEEMNRAIWEEAANSWRKGKLAGIFIECSYDSSRPAHLMFGHISPPGLYHELQTLASLVSRPLDGLRIFITHIKDALVPHPSGKTSKERIIGELLELEKHGKLGLEFAAVKRGDRICAYLSEKSQRRSAEESLEAD